MNERVVFSMLVYISVTPVKVAFGGRRTRLPPLETRAGRLAHAERARTTPLRSRPYAGRAAPALQRSGRVARRALLANARWLALPCWFLRYSVRLRGARSA